MRSIHLPARAALAIAAALLLMAATAGAAFAQSPSPAPSVPAASSIPFASPGADGVIPVVPDPSVIGDGTPTPWNHVAVSADGKTLTVYYEAGAQPCNSLKSVEVTTANGVTTITVLIGRLQSAMGMMCIQGQFEYSTTVTLDSPILADGAPA